MNKTSKILSWFLGAYIVLDIFGYSLIVSYASSLKLFFVIIPMTLLVWQIYILRERFRHFVLDSKASFYEYVEANDWQRLFWIFFIIDRPLATDFIWGFFLFSGIVFILLVFIIITVLSEYFRERKVNTLIFGCAVFSFFLLTWTKNTYVIHYGVPIIDHFLEKPEYETKYRIEVQKENSMKKITAIADISVEGRVENEYDGEEDWLGQEIERTFTFRDVWIKRIHFPNGTSIAIDDQSEPLHLGEYVFVDDIYGNSWYVELLDKPIN